MNGALPCTFLTIGGPRLYAALMVSCLLHAALVLMPYFGTGARGAQKPAAARALDVRLEPASASAAMAAGKPSARGTGLLPIPAPTYYRSDQLTRPPRPTSQPKLDVPRAVARSVSGRVILKLWINELGNVDSVEVESSNLPETVSGPAAAAFGKLRFVPGEIDGRRVRALMRIEVAYAAGKRPPP